MRPRGFTVLETVLAATLASVVVLGCMGAFFALERTDRTLAARFDEANDLARIQRTMERAFATLLVAEQSPEDAQAAALNAAAEETEEDGEQPEEDERVDEEADEEEEEADTEESLAPEPVQMPRILLEPDLDPMLTSMLSRARFAAGGGGSSVAAPQRLELVLSSVPIRPPSVQSTAWASALVGVEDVEEQEAGEEAGLEEYAGVRGAFVLRPDELSEREANARRASGDDRIGWTLWWQPLDGRSEPARVASGLAACNFQMFYDRQMMTELIAYDADQIPTYIQLEVETLTGLYANYLFEVVWTVDELEEAEASGETGAEGENGDGGNGRGPNGGAGDGGPGGPGGADRRRNENGARPKLLTPRGAGPGGAVTARPGEARRAPAGGGGDTRQQRGNGGGGRGGGG